MWTFLFIWLLSGYVLWHVAYQLFEKLEHEQCRSITVGHLFLGLLMMWLGLLWLFPILLVVTGLLIQTYYDPLSEFFSRRALTSPCEWFRKKQPEPESNAPDIEKIIGGDWKK